MTALAEPGPLTETVCTTRDPDGTVNLAAMGCRLGTEEVVFWPFHGTRTLRNLRARPEGVVHRVDDVLLFAQAALGHPSAPLVPAAAIDGARLADCLSWAEFRVREIAEPDDGLPRCRVRAEIVAGGQGTACPAGLCRAHHAVLEASILASRLRHLEPGHVHAELARLRVLVEKTGGPRERAGMDYVSDFAARRR